MPLPAASLNDMIVIVSGPALRHQYAALRIHAAFPKLTAAWLQAPSGPGSSESEQKSWKRRFRIALRNFLSPVPAALSQDDTDARILGRDVERLRAGCGLRATVVDDAADARAHIQEMAPRFVVFAGVQPRCEREFVGCARDLTLAQREGWLPDYQGPDAVLRALYHRDLAGVAASIEVVGTGCVLRRTTACLALDDTLQTCVTRCAALGADLMCETLAGLVENRPRRFFAGHAADAPVRSGLAPTADAEAEVEALVRQGFIGRGVAMHQSF